VSVDAVADAADRTSGAIYAHFGSKDALVTAVLDAWKDQVAAVVAAVFEAAEDLPTRLDGLWATFIDPPDALGDRWLLLEHELWARAVRDPALREQLARRYADARGAMADRLEAWDAGTPGVDPVAPPDETSTLLLALLIGLEMQRRLDPAAVSDDVALTGLLALLGAPHPSTAPPKTTAPPKRGHPR
jgi:AcrR family transcriptional regulator